MARRVGFEERFAALLFILDGNDWGAEQVATVLGCTVQRARYFVRNDLEIRRKNFYKKLNIFAESEENANY